jgi:hypothetical protein
MILPWVVCLWTRLARLVRSDIRPTATHRVLGTMSATLMLAMRIRETKRVAVAVGQKLRGRFVHSVNRPQAVDDVPVRQSMSPG